MSLYGCVLWDLSSPHVDAFYVAWRKCIRRLLRIPYRSHCNLLHLICDDLPPDKQIHRRVINFINQCLVSNNSCTRLCAQLCVNGSRSNVSKSFNLVCAKYNINRHFVIMNEKIDTSQVYIHGHDDENDYVLATAGIIRDFLWLKDHTAEGVRLQYIIDFLCTE